MEQKIEDYFSKYNFDIKINGDGRYMDQKITPDVLSVIADSLVQFIDDMSDKESFFTAEELWNYEYLNSNVKEIFGKPDMHNETAKHEYDKFVQQPLKMLSAAKILECEKRENKNHFKIVNYELLEYISVREMNAYRFISIYVEKVMTDTGIISFFYDYFSNPNKYTYIKVKNIFIDTIQKYTNIKGYFEPKRLFPKVINPLALKYNSYGTEKGRISKHKIKFADLRYNRENFRDVNKDVSETRTEYAKRVEEDSYFGYTDKYKNYMISKAKKIIRKLHGNFSEVKDEFANGDATQVHHIFPASEFPQIADYIENMILLTPTQHFTKAHLNNYTMYIDTSYQAICLLSKLQTVKSFVESGKTEYYSKENYINVLSIGTSSKLNDDMTFEQLEEYLIDLYNVA